MTKSHHDGMTEYPGAVIYAINPAVYYVPFIADDGRVGYVCRNNDGKDQRETYIYLNPSTNTDDGMPNVFVYVGGENSPADDDPVSHVTLEQLL